MIRIRRLFAAAVLVAAGGVVVLSGDVEAAVYEPETFTLDNGMQVVVVTNRSAPVVTHMVWYKAGAADEPPGRSGIAHYLEHLMFKGTANVPDGEFNRRIARNGGRDNAFTSWDYTGYFQNIAADRLPMVMELEADRMVNLILTEEQILTERDVIIEERRQRIDNNPGGRLGEQMMAALYQNHPYGTPIIGWEQEMAALTLDDAVEWYRTWYAPNNAVLVVSGDIDAAELRPLAEQYYGVIPARPVPERIRPVEPDIASERRVILRHPDVQQRSWRRFYLAPSYRTADGNDVYALQVLSEILGGGTTGRLYRSLVIDQQIAVAAGTGYSGNDFDQTRFIAYLAPAPETEMKALDDAFDAVVDQLLADGVTGQEVADAKSRMITGADYARDSVSGPARALGASLTVGRTIADVEAWPDRIAEVSAEDVLRMARIVFDLDRSVTGYLLRAEPSSELTQ